MICSCMLHCSYVAFGVCTRWLGNYHAYFVIIYAVNSAKNTPPLMFRCYLRSAKDVDLFPSSVESHRNDRNCSEVFAMQQNGLLF